MSEITSNDELLDSREEERYVTLVEAVTKTRGRLGVTFEWGGQQVTISHIPREYYLQDGADEDMAAPTWGVLFRGAEVLEQNESSILITHVEDDFYFEENGHLGRLLESYQKRYDTETGTEVGDVEEHPPVDLFATFQQAAAVADSRRPVKKEEFYSKLVPALEHAIMLDDAQLLDIEENK